jgi:hypothetical protein
MQIFHHDNTGGFLMKVESETPPVFLIQLELHPSSYETKKSVTLTLWEKKKVKQILIGQRVLGKWQV